MIEKGVKYLNSYIKNLFRNKNTFQGRINIAIFLTNFVLLILHIILEFFYLSINIEFLSIINALSTFCYLYFLFSATEKIKAFTYVTFIEIWIHMIIAVLSFGLDPGFQNWCYALVCAFYLPSFSNNQNNDKYQTRRPLWVAVTFILTYYGLILTLRIFEFNPKYILSDIINHILFICNTFITFVTIIIFTKLFSYKNRRAQIELTRRADYDELTHLYNRYAITSLSEKIIENADYLKENYHVAILDIDHFKLINDTYGHNSGDMVLTELANILRMHSIKGITPARWGGEEFVVISPSTINYEHFLKVLEKLRTSVEKKKFKIEKRKSINITISIGATTSTAKSSLEDTISKADLNLYQAKETGRNKLIYD